MFTSLTVRLVLSMLGKGFSLVAFSFKEKFSQDKEGVKRFIQKRENTLQGVQIELARRCVSWVLCCGCVGFSRLWGHFLWVWVTSLAREPPQMLPPHFV